MDYMLNQKNSMDKSEITNKNFKVQKLKDDIFVGAAIRTLLVSSPEKINTNLKKIFKEFEAAESEKIIKKLADLDIDWSLNPFIKTPYPENLKLKFELEKISTDLLRIKVKIKNVGKIIGQRLIVVTKASNVLLDGLEFPIGKLSPGEELSRTISVKFSPGMMQEVEPFEMVLYDQNIKKLKTLHSQLNFFPKGNTSFMLSTKIFDNGVLGSMGNGDGIVQPGETIALSFNVVNQGEIVVPELLLKIKGAEGSFRINRGKILLKELVPGNENKDYFIFQALSSNKNMGKIRMEMIDTKSSNPKIFRSWNLNKKFAEQKEFTPFFDSLKIKDVDGNILKGKTNFDSIILTGGINNPDNLSDIFVHLNNEKIFYSANIKSRNKIKDYLFRNKQFQFSTKIKLLPGINIISVFARNNLGMTSERRIRILLKKL